MLLKVIVSESLCLSKSVSNIIKTQELEQSGEQGEDRQQGKHFRIQAAWL